MLEKLKRLVCVNFPRTDFIHHCATKTMHFITVCLIVINITVFIFSAKVIICRKISPKARRSITFNDLTPRVRISYLSTYLLDKISTLSRRECAIKCLMNPECKSYSFCKTYCELNAIGVTELRRNERHYVIFTVADENCDLFSMQKDFTPQCEEFGSFRSIRVDSDPNYCQINKKRADGLFLEREYCNATIDATYEYKGFTTRRCVLETALNGGYCKVEYETKPVWVKWRYNAREYADNYEYCQSIGGMLYPDLDGDAKQVEFLKKYVNWKFFFGIQPDGEWYRWKNLRGEKMGPDRIRWWEHNYVWKGHFVYTVNNDPAVKITNQWGRAKAVCQMII